jgi:hypothetical protein
VALKYRASGHRSNALGQHIFIGADLVAKYGPLVKFYALYLAYFALSLSAIMPRPALAGDFSLTPAIASIEDRRSTGSFGKCEITFHLVGDDLDQAEAVRTVFDSVVDDSGRNLLIPSES